MDQGVVYWYVIHTSRGCRCKPAHTEGKAESKAVRTLRDAVLALRRQKESQTRTQMKESRFPEATLQGSQRDVTMGETTILGKAKSVARYSRAVRQPTENGRLSIGLGTRHCQFSAHQSIAFTRRDERSRMALAAKTT